jgi:ketosteroid isomerase-like protein
MAVTSREVVERMLSASQAMDVDEIVALMAPDGYLEWPYRPAGVPARIQGREQIREYLTGAAKAPIRFHEYRDLVVHETTDPEVIIVEYEAHGSVTTTGDPYRQSIIAVYRVRGGQIVALRDYLDPLALAQARASVEPANAD